MGSLNPTVGDPHVVGLYKDETGGAYVDLQFTAQAGSGPNAALAGSYTVRVPALSLSPASQASVIMHEALYAYSRDWETNGLAVPKSATRVGYPRVTLRNAAVERVKGVWQIPEDWTNVAFRWGWTNEGAPAGSVNFTFSYRMVDLLTEGDVDAGAMTDIAIPAIAAPGQFDSKYENPSVVQNIFATPGGFFGNKPSMLWTLERDGVADSCNTDISVLVTTLTRVI